MKWPRKLKYKWPLLALEYFVYPAVFMHRSKTKNWSKTSTDQSDTALSNFTTDKTNSDLTRSSVKGGDTSLNTLLVLCPECK